MIPPHVHRHSTKLHAPYVPASACALARSQDKSLEGIKMKTFAPVLLAASVAILCFSNAHADEAAPPVYKIGDTWSYAYVDELTPANNSASDQTVVQVSTEHTVLEGKRATGQAFEVELDPNGNLMHSGQYAPTPNDGRLKFPMSVGASWLFEYDVGSVHYKGENKVAAMEDIQTKAGSLQAYRIESSGEFTSAGWHDAGRFAQTIWYAPSVKRIVKADWISKFGARTTQTTTHLELTKFQLAQ